MRTGSAGRGGGGAGLRPCGREEPLDLPDARDVAGAPERARGVDVRVAMVLKLVGGTRDTSAVGRVSGARSPEQQTDTQGHDPRGEQDGADAEQDHGPVGLLPTASHRLIETANESGGPDNITCVLARWVE